MEEFSGAGVVPCSSILYEGNVREVCFLRINFNLYLETRECRYKYDFTKNFINMF